MNNLMHKFFYEESGKGSQEFGSAIAFSMIILCVAVGMFYGIQNGLVNGLTDRSNYVASHANQHMY
jgi:hypothetical protein